MRIFTSYYGNIKKLGKADVQPISISLMNPKWFKGSSIKFLAPTWATFNSKTTEDYKRRFNRQLDNLDRKEVLRLIKSTANGRDCAILCYERPDDFCHRHIVAKWLNEVLSEDEQIVEFGEHINPEPIVTQESLF